MLAKAAGRLPVGHLWYLLRRMRNEKPHRFDGQLRINSFFPPYPSQAFERFLSAVIQRRRVPYSAYLAVTSECPYSCEHCSYIRRPAPDMSSRQMLDVIDQVKGLGGCTLGLTGGEPLLRADLEELVAAAAPQMATIVFTTGYGLDAARAGRLAQAGVTCVTVGVESAEPGSHDEVRGASGSFAQARQAVSACRQAGIYTALSTIATPRRIASGQLERIYRLGADWGVGELRVLAPVATGAARGCECFTLMQPQRRTLHDFHISHNRRRGGPAVASFAYLESDQMFGCGAGYHHMFIDAAGQVCPCDLTPLSFGDITREPLADIWDRMGTYFPLPRCGCLMGKLAGKIAGQELPLARAESESLCSLRRADEPLPQVYRRLFRE